MDPGTRTAGGPFPGLPIGYDIAADAQNLAVSRLVQASAYTVGRALDSRGCAMLRWASTAVLASLLAAYAQVSCAQNSLGLVPTESASSLTSSTNRRFRFVCPAIEVPTTNIWGTDEYTDDSAICTAAIHAGVLKLQQAGVVTIVTGRTASSFTGSERNGVTSASYANSYRYYRFDTYPDAAAIAWTTTAMRIPPDFLQPVTVVCPAGGTTTGIVWGTDTYTSDSSICLAAVHAGVITLAEGGAVTVTKSKGAQTYEATTRNGIASRAWSTWNDAFTVSAGTTDGSAPKESSGRRIRVDGFTGVGETLPPKRRIISTEGWTGVGAVQ